MLTSSYCKSDIAEEKKRCRDVYEGNVEESVNLIEETSHADSKTVKKRGPKKKKLKSYDEVLLTLSEKEAYKKNDQFQFRLYIPLVLEEILKEQEILLLAPLYKGPLPQLPWQSKLPTVARILENFSGRHEDQCIAQHSYNSECLPDPKQPHPPHSVLKVKSNSTTILSSMSMLIELLRHNTLSGDDDHVSRAFR
jgi:hypothetical protein